MLTCMYSFSFDTVKFILCQVRIVTLRFMFVMLPYNSINLNVSVFLTNLYGLVHLTSAYTILAVIKCHHLFYCEGRRKYKFLF